MKKIITFLFLLCSIAAYSQTKINVGTAANDGTGDPLRTAFQKTNVIIDTTIAHNTRINTKASIARVNLKVNIADTASMLLPYGTRLNSIEAQLADTLNIDELGFITESSIEDIVVISVSDTTVTASLGRIVFKTSDSTFYGCRSTTYRRKWYKLND